MPDSKCDFYPNYSPSERVQKRLPPPEKDIGYKAPYRDILGVLEDLGATRKKDAVSLPDIKEHLEEWDQKRERAETIPTLNRIRTQLKEDLYWDGIILKKDTREGEKYWKLPDNQVPHRYQLLVINALRKSEEPLKTVLCRQTIVSLSVVLYIISSFLYITNIIGYELMVVSVISYFIGHGMAYRGESIVP